MPPIRIAIMGSGIFARDSHVPALKALRDIFEVVAIYSRNAQTAADLATTFPGNVETYTELESLMARDNLDAVDIILPIAIQPKAIEIALRASKHVISEKPIAPDVVSGRHLLQIAREVSVRTGTVWMIAENIRYEPVFQRAGEIIRRGDIGKLIQMDWTTASVFNRENKYYQTAWRRDNSFPGGLILDGGIHNIAAMRAVMGEIESVSAFVAQTRPDLPPADTLSAALRFVNGAIGSWTTTFAAESPWIDGALRILGDQGALRLNFGQLDFFSDGKTTTQAFPVNAVEQELTDFAQAIQGKTPFSTPEQALQDAIVIEAILDSARTGRIIQPECIV